MLLYGRLSVYFTKELEVMERLLRPTQLDVDPNAAEARQTFKHWLRTLEHFLIAAQAARSEEEPLSMNMDLL